MNRPLTSGRFSFRGFRKLPTTLTRPVAQASSRGQGEKKLMFAGFLCRLTQGRRAKVIRPASPSPPSGEGDFIN
jgi:hypothetical protein